MKNSSIISFDNKKEQRGAESMLQNIEVISKASIFNEYAQTPAHTSLETEHLFYQCIRDGDVEKTKKMMAMLLSGSIIMGKLSEDELRQNKYWAVCCITLAVRYAVAGGLNESEAFDFSDKLIMKIDKINDKNEVLNCLKDYCVELTKMVSKSKEKNNYPYQIKKCIHYITMNFNEKLDIKTLSEKCSLSPDYLSALFKKTTGKTISSYINIIRLEKAKQLLFQGYKSSDIAYYLNYCSESYFIKCFKAYVGVTPKKFFNMQSGAFAANSSL